MVTPPVKKLTGSKDDLADHHAREIAKQARTNSTQFRHRRLAKDFIAAAMSTRTGWVITAASTYLKRYYTFIVDEHDIGAIVGSYPVIVLDLWEHSRRDYLNNKKEYIIAMMKELNWNVIEERFKRADIILQVVQ